MSVLRFSFSSDIYVNIKVAAFELKTYLTAENLTSSLRNLLQSFGLPKDLSWYHQSIYKHLTILIL